jgi:toxin co-regulated pilus biosynthesis protein E
MLDLAKKLQQLLFTRQEQRAFLEDLTNLIKDGVPAPQAIATIQELATGSTSTAAKDILGKISEGQNISDGMINWFPPPIVEIIRSGEQGGVLTEAMKAAVEFLAQRSSAITSLLNSLIYPSAVLIMGLIVAVFLKHTVFANYATMQPINTWPENGQLLMGIANFIQIWWWLVLIIIISLIFFLREILINVTGDMRKIIDKIPPLSLYRDYAAARLMETLGLLLTNRITFKHALTILQHNATRYLAWHIYLMQFRLSAGRENIADVLDTGIVKPADMLRLRVMAKGKGFDQALLHLGGQALTRNTRNVVGAGKIIGVILLTVDALFLAFMIFAVYGVGSYVGSF